jgi:hypothetical protein
VSCLSSGASRSIASISNIPVKRTAVPLRGPSAAYLGRYVA